MTEMTIARQRLATLLTERSGIEERSRQLSAQIKELRNADLAVTAIRQQLAELDKAEVAAMAAGGGALDLKARGRLNAELTEATAKAATAQSAIDVIRQSQAMVTAKVGDLSRKIEMAKAPILLEAADHLVAALEATVRALHQHTDEALVAADTIAEVARHVGRLDTPQADLAMVQPTLLAVEKLNGRINDALASVPNSIRPARDSRWSDLIEALSYDASAQLEAPGV